MEGIIIHKERIYRRGANHICTDIVVVNDKYILLLMVGTLSDPWTQVYIVHLIGQPRLDEVKYTGPTFQPHPDPSIFLSLTFCPLFASPSTPHVFYTLGYDTITREILLYKLEIDLNTMRDIWEIMQLTNHMQYKPIEHAIMRNDTIYCFDYVNDASQPGYKMLDTLNIKNRHWNTISTRAPDGNWPKQRNCQSITQHNGIIYMLGGAINTGLVHGIEWVMERNYEVWTLDLSTNEWKLSPSRLSFSWGRLDKQRSMVTLDGALIIGNLGGTFQSIFNVRAPMLRSMAMHNMIQTVPMLKTMSLKQLLAFGVPRDLAQLIKDGSGAHFEHRPQDYVVRGIDHID